jgi:DNA-binding NarL/FixJ family response regulator
MPKIKVLIADDHRLILESVQATLEAAGDFEVVATTTEATRVAALVGETAPDLVLLDVRMPELDGLTCLTRLRRRFPRLVVVMMSGSEEPAIRQQALDGGASAFVLKHIDPRELGGVLRQALGGTVYQSPPIFDERARALAAEAGLTTKEHEILNLLALGLSNREIGGELRIAEQTVKFHLSNVYRKLGVGKRTAAIEAARARGLIPNPLLQQA